MTRRALPTLSPLQWKEKILAGDRTVLARAITLAESTLARDQALISNLLKGVILHTGKSIRIGVTGVPGVGKSTFIESFGPLLTAEGRKVAVLTVDPSSQKTKGSILGDKTRMDTLSRNPDVFIRPSPSGLALGGVTLHTREAILLCEAAGFDVILIETVGVGQSETQVRGMVDFFLLLMLAGAGDELQGIKKGIVEMADGIAITKADGANTGPAKQAMADAAHALHFQTQTISGWKPKVMTISSVESKGLKEVWKGIQDFESFTRANGYFEKNRKQQRVQWLEDSIESRLKARLEDPKVSSSKKKLVKAILDNRLLPDEAAEQLWKVAIPPKKKK